MNDETSDMKLSYLGLVEQPAIEVACSRYQGSMEGMQPRIGEGFMKLFKACGNKVTGGRPLMVCEDFNEKEGTVSMVMAVPAASGQFDEFEKLTVPGGKYFHAVMLGNYQNLAKAWPEAIGKAIAEGSEQDPQRHMYEVYDNDPQVVKNPAEFQTSLYIPVK